jgi:hypothetical protein
MIAAFKKKSKASYNFPRCSYSIAPLLYAIAKVNLKSFTFSRFDFILRLYSSSIFDYSA